MTSRIAALLVQAREVRVVLSGKGIKPAVGYCRWNPRHRIFQCGVRVPRHIAVGKSRPYLLTAQEKPQGRFVAATWVFTKAFNPETVYFTRASGR